MRVLHRVRSSASFIFPVTSCFLKVIQWLLTSSFSSSHVVYLSFNYATVTGGEQFPASNITGRLTTAWPSPNIGMSLSTGKDHQYQMPEIVEKQTGPSTPKTVNTISKQAISPLNHFLIIFNTPKYHPGYSSCLRCL
jgi:hypothetical protein